MQKVLIAGGAGFIGSHTADLLMEKGIKVRVLDNLTSGFRSNLPADNPLLEFIEGDIRNADTVKAAMEGVTHVVHLAAQVSVVASLEDPEFSAQQNIIGYLNVLDAAKNAGVKRMVYASSAAIYGEPHVLPLTEDVPMKQLSPYGLEKKFNEDYADLYYRLYNFTSVGMRFFNVYGPRQDPKSPYAGVIALFMDRIKDKLPLVVNGDGEHSRDFVYVRDVARTNVAALELDYHGACNVATGKRTTLLDLIRVLSEVTDNEANVSHVEAREGDIVHSLADTSVMNKQLNVVAETELNEGLAKLLESVS
ncbi:UDP-glucose 4-epimerase [hydrothermal vent metagenome]|uniref:UDP-glucose 4-epimerase n=1 Tax=hydrothermal vent metagenome TaxID=652676 RepID=A0A3B0X3R1_9ZZZZ